MGAQRETGICARRVCMERRESGTRVFWHTEIVLSCREGTKKMAVGLERKGNCSSCNGAVVGEKGQTAGVCVKCGAKVTNGHGEPSDAIRNAVRETLIEFGFEKKVKAAAKQEEDDL